MEAHKNMRPQEVTKVYLLDKEKINFWRIDRTKKLGLG